MTVGSLFAGIGGFDLGFKRAGYDVRWQVEIDDYCTAVLEKHWPTVRRHRDVRTFHPRERTDVVVGGFPCQPVSSASHRRRYSTAHPAWLWPEMRRVYRESECAWVVGENVAALDRAELDTVVSDLEADGYEVAPPFEVPACAFGFDHWRPRLWILGYAHSHRQSGRTIHAEACRLSQSRDDARSMGEAYGVSRGLDSPRRRMRALGNAIVPQIAQWIAERIKEAELAA
jgi:DNA (cytosine-5)-methyltransferase 1